MGDEIATAGFRAEDFSLFARRLAEETEFARAMFAEMRFSQAGFSLGFEIEAWIVDHNFFPAPINQRLLEALRNPLVVPELSRFNVELNSEPLALGADALDRAEEALSRLWGQCNAVAHGLGANMVMIGTLPTIRDEDLTLANISPLNRYYALNKEVLRRRSGRPLRIDIEGRDHLVCEHRDVMLEAAATSFQIHLQVPADLAVLYYNASVAASGPLLAACGNSPLLFGKRLWEETRIPLFEQAVDMPGVHVGPRRVSMGSNYLERSCLEIFEENLRDHPPLLPISFDDAPEALHHLRLHNGTIWRWNRPLVGFDADGSPHLRIEQRILPAGPTIADMMANTALYLGLDTPSRRPRRQWRGRPRLRGSGDEFLRRGARRSRRRIDLAGRGQNHGRASIDRAVAAGGAERLAAIWPRPKPGSAARCRRGAGAFGANRRGMATRGLRGAWRKRPSAHGRLLRKTTRRRADA